MKNEDRFPIGQAVRLKMFNQDFDCFPMMINQHINERKPATNDEYEVFFGYECVWHDRNGRPQKEVYRHECLFKLD